MMTTANEGAPFDGLDKPQVSSDFFHGDINDGLARMRLRLLDLTTRNRLLSFRHTKKSSLRVVDELPDQLFNQLRDGGELVFKPVPRPPRPRPAREEEESDNSLVEPEVDTYISTLKRKESTAARYPTAKEHAESLGLASSFDLPIPDAVPKVLERHTDDEIQTLHYPEDLESILRKIESAARLAIEETGTNMLYLVFGFLEWCESDASNESRFAPLLMLPVSLRRELDPATRTYRYFVQYSGEDIVPNISLQEKMRRDYNLDIPDFADEDSPESYFAKLQIGLASQKRWNIHRQITLTLLSFGKLLLFRDLDPRNWPSGARLDNHPRIKEFFLGIQQEGISFAQEYRIDDPALRPRVPELVYDADSSQHSALIDALGGKNLVIEGPPGTGKSQTITNLIATALTQGKTVLFVSEKLAALEVVRRRLDEAGLGLFCLELHSHKTQKRALLDDINRRIEQHWQLRDPRDLDEKLQLLDRHKQQLTAYVELINKPFGRLGHSIYDLLWAFQRCRRTLGFDATL